MIVLQVAADLVFCVFLLTIRSPIATAIAVATGCVSLVGATLHIIGVCYQQRLFVFAYVIAAVSFYIYSKNLG